MSKRKFYVYILANKTGSAYVGITNDLECRVWEHKRGEIEGFAKRYMISMLMYYEEFDYVEHAIRREKEIKRWRKEKKRELIESMNPKWVDLAADWFEQE
jgi:putative endonuclease